MCFLSRIIFGQFFLLLDCPPELQSPAVVHTRSGFISEESVSTSSGTNSSTSLSHSSRIILGRLRELELHHKIESDFKLKWLKKFSCKFQRSADIAREFKVTICYYNDNLFFCHKKGPSYPNNLWIE